MPIKLLVFIPPHLCEWPFFPVRVHVALPLRPMKSHACAVQCLPVTHAERIRCVQVTIVAATNIHCGCYGNMYTKGWKLMQVKGLAWPRLHNRDAVFLALCLPVAAIVICTQRIGNTLLNAHARPGGIVLLLSVPSSGPLQPSSDFL